MLVLHRSVLLAVTVAALLAALASSSAPFVTTAAASEALKNRLAELTSFATGVEIDGALDVRGGDSAASLARQATAMETAGNELRARLGHLGPPVVTLQASGFSGSGVGVEARGITSVVLMTRTDALAHVHVEQEVAGPGVFVSDITAQAAGVKPGGTLRITGLEGFGRQVAPRVRVKGVYRALAHSPVTDYWGSLYHEIYPQTLDAPVPPSFLFLTPAAFDKLLGGAYAGVASSVELPIDSRGLTLNAARALEPRFAALPRELRSSSLGEKLGCIVVKCGVITSLSAAVILANDNARAVTPAITLLSDLGTGIALVVAAAAGIFIVRRRRAEAALVYARGGHVAGFAARTGLEVFVPTLAGGAAGFALAYGLTDVFAPTGSIASGTVWSGAVHAAVAVAIAVALLVLVAAVAFTRLYDTGSRGRRWVRWLPWELPVGVAAVVLFLRIRSGGGVSSGTERTPTLAVFLYPLLLVTAVAGVAARAARVLLRRSSGRARHGRAAVYLALRRLAAARGLVVALGVVAAVSLGSLFYVETLATSLQRTTVEKAYMATGSDANALVPTAQLIPKHFPYPTTIVDFANQAATLSDDVSPVDVMLVDPATLARTLHWESDWGPNPTGFLRKLAQAPSQPLPAIVTDDLAHTKSIVIDGRSFTLDELAVVHAFPFMAQGIPLVVTSFRALHDLEQRTRLFDSLGVLQGYVWAKGPPLAAGRALATLRPEFPPQTTDTFLRDPNVVLATRTFGFMRLIAAGAGVLALLGLLLYLQARQRSQAIASVLARRMGLGRLEETASLTIELGGILAFAGLLGGGVAIAAAEPIVHRIDPLPVDPPSPLFTVPVAVLLISAAALLVFALVSGALTSWLARRTDIAEALRVA